MSIKKFFLPIIFVLISLYAVLGVFHSSIAFNWTFQDWLINYEGGFIRRGLSGQIIEAISSYFFNQNKIFYFGAQIHLVYFYIVSFFCILFYALMYRLIKDESFNLQNLFIIFSPLSITFIIYNGGAVGRKEILYFIFFLAFLYIIEILKKKELSIFFLIIFFPLILLLHEGLIFFISAFLVIFLFEINKVNKKFILSTTLIFVLLSFSVFIILAVMFEGNSTQVEAICLSLSNYPIRNCTGMSAIGTLSIALTTTSFLSNEFDILWNRVIEDKYLFYYPIFAIIAFFPLIMSSSKYWFNISVGNKVYKLNFSIIAIIYFVNSLPLYIFAHDWGRWLYITYILLLITFFHLKKMNKIYLKNVKASESVTDNNDYLKIFLLIIVLIFYSTVLSVSYVGGYTQWIYDYTTMDDQLKFYFNVIKTIPYLF
tara:strand:+ start:125 stop:1405 length:1281 start_codon:yes stop_codon:yes gene_type:complete